MSNEEQSDPAGRSLVKRCQESEPALIFVIFSFLFCQSEVKYRPLVEKWQRHKNCQSIMFDEERLDPHGVGNLPHVLTIKILIKVIHIWIRRTCSVSALITDVLTKF